MKAATILVSVVWTAAVITTSFLASQGGSAIVSAMILTLVPLIGTAVNGFFTRKRIQKIEDLAAKNHTENTDKLASVEKKVDGAASTLAENTKAATELAKAIETGKVKELQATIDELRKQILNKRKGDQS